MDKREYKEGPIGTFPSPLFQHPAQEVGLAEVTGYSRATIYKHWPTRNALFVDAFAHRPSGKHHVPGGDLRADLIAELTMFRLGMERQRLDRALAALAALTTSVPELAPVRTGSLPRANGSCSSC